ncbi:SbcC/MukB-like Walker B domain-containing protein [Algoriphagus sp. A40]|uniref:SbcC/MukB-like Walker B domain-containing protein n=1 Tax=Algoriphagus sp. A40 TaxID=1945863 RepID=UPI0009853258|nr:SMC family ATPase [Algoriphagus sp. A40]OOG78436.1 recombinase RecF [Algoriphagus sp. A40]
MIPVRLEIEGLYSYREKQTVEFDQLTAAGLFGIFGAVGSGKSSILEGILLALYGSTERLAATGERSSMVNLQSDQLLINFTFRAGKNNAQTYLARYSAKRNKKDREKIDTGEHTFYTWRNGTWEATDQNAEQLIGMRKEHFKQTVIIPQGKFREFIDLTPGPRAEMMQQLFGLERFDLSFKTSSLLKIAREEKIRLETQLNGLLDISEDGLNNRKSQFAELKNQNEEADQKLKKSESDFRQMELIRKSYLQLLEQKLVLTELENRKSEIEVKRQVHREFITAKTYLRPVWDRLNDAKKDLEKNRVSVTNCERFKITFRKEVEDLEEEAKELVKKNEERSAREAKIRDLKKVIEIKELEEKLRESSKSLETLQPEIDEKKSSLKTQEKQLAELEEKLETSANPDANLLSELKSATRDLSLWQTKLSDLKRIQTAFLNEEKSISAQLEAILGKIPADEKNLETWAKSQKARIHELESEREKVLRKQGLNAHAHLLIPGEPCPFCGSTHHPDPIKAEADLREIREKELSIQKEKDYLEQILSLIQKQNELGIHLENQRRNGKEKVTEIQNYETQLNALSARLNDLEVADLTKLDAQIQILSESSTYRENLLKEIQSLRKGWQFGREAMEKAEKLLQQAQLIHQTWLTQIRSKKEEIKDPTFCLPFFSKETEAIRTMISNVTKDIEDAVKLLNGMQKHLQEKRAEQIKNLSDLENFQNRVRELEVNVAGFGADFEKLKIEYGFTDEEALIRIFHHSIDAEKADLEIRQFDQKLSNTLSRIAELKAEVGVEAFSEDNFQRLRDELQIFKTAALEIQEALILLQEDIKTFTQKLADKIVLLKAFSKTEYRESNLRELDRLFQGKGFVKYVSSIYLRELCNTANLRFMKLTKNSLSLEIDEDNTFWVMDYLNGGKKRLLKTLSGGQTFQASLCLALALAEKVKALNQADQSFFFLDEGFGALDRNSLRVVFETLKALRHENRVVGIISHVEELQQEVGVYVQIELDPDRGSQVSYSY